MNRAEAMQKASEQLRRAETLLLTSPQIAKDRVEQAEAFIKYAAELRKEPL